jgi:hypothetical protein
MSKSQKKKRKFAKRGYADIEAEMVKRGEEVTAMIRIFNAVKNLLPEGPRESFEKIARGYAKRNDADRGSVYCKGQIDFRDEGIRYKKRTADQQRRTKKALRI